VNQPYMGTGQPQQQPALNGGQPKAGPIVIPGRKRSEMGTAISDELRGRYREAPGDLDLGPGEWAGVVTFSKLDTKDGTRQLGLCFGVETANGPRAWWYNVDYDKVPDIFLESVVALIPDYDEAPITDRMFKGKWGVLVVKFGTGAYSEMLRVRSLKPIPEGFVPPVPGEHVQQHVQAPQQQAPQQFQQPQAPQQFQQPQAPQQFQHQHQPQAAQPFQQPQQPQTFQQPQTGGYAQRQQPQAPQQPQGYVEGIGQTYGGGQQAPAPQPTMKEQMGVSENELPF